MDARQIASSSRARTHFAGALERSDALAAIVSSDGLLEHASAGLRAIVGADGAMDSWRALTGKSLEALAGGATRVRVEGEIASSGGTPRCVALELISLDRNTGSVLVLGRDLTDDRERETQLGLRALTDPVTGLPNRSLLADRVGQALLVSERAREPIALIVLDLDRFKEVNDTYGHRVGDLLLAQVGRRIRASLRDSDTVARLGGDEFAILLPPPADLISAHATAWKVDDALKARFDIAGLAIEVRASMGLALAPDHARSAEDLVDKADVAMYVAKRARTRVAVYDADHDLRSPEFVARVAALRDAIAADRLDLSFQPAIRLLDGEVVGAEALVRWDHPTLGRLLPAEFVPLAERSGLSGPLSSWVLRHALQRLGEWRTAGVHAGVSVNVSGRELLDAAFLEMVKRELAERRIEPSVLSLDISERALSGNWERLLVPLHALARLGVRIALDDFGTGTSSLGLLRRLPLAEIKIDQRLIGNFLVDAESWSLVRSGIDIAHDLGLDVGAEGVEDRDTRDVLAKLGCDLAQGRYFSTSLSRERFAFLETDELEAAVPA